MKKVQILFTLFFIITTIGLVSAITGAIGNSKMILLGTVDETIEKYVLVKNVNDVSVNIEISASGDLKDEITIIDKEFTLLPGEEKKAYFQIRVEENGTKEGKIDVKFLPISEGNGVGLSSTIILIAEKLERKSFALILAELDSETPKAIPGEQLIINANIRNIGDSETTYTISVLGNNKWSGLDAIDPETITLARGESENVKIYLDIDKDATGDKDFTIRASYDGKTTDQDVEISIEEESPSEILGSIGNARMVLRIDVGEQIEKYILVKNVNDVPIAIQLSAEGDLKDYIDIKDKEFELNAGEEKKAYFTIKATESGTTESKINIKFIPEEGNSVGLTSTIIVIANANETSGGGDGGSGGGGSTQPINLDKCETIGLRKTGEYCSSSKEWENQRKSDKSCNNSFECESNVCVSDKCVSAGLLQKIINFFKKFFSFS